MKQNASVSHRGFTGKNKNKTKRLAEPLDPVCVPFLKKTLTTGMRSQSAQSHLDRVTDPHVKFALRLAAFTYLMQ